MFKTYTNVWFCGLAASGKTTVLRFLNKKLKNIEFLNDSLEIIEFIQKDVEQKHHKKPSPDSFVLTDSQATQYSIHQLVEKASATNKNKIIELSRGLDSQGIVDFSYAYLFSNLSEELKKNSLFIYIYSPIEIRKLRNQNRPKLSKNATVLESFFCPNEAFDRFFLNDDFFQAVQNHPVDHLFIPNIYGIDHLERKINNLF